MMQRDALGNRIAPGRSLKYEWDAVTGALPSWLTLGSAGLDAGSTLTFGGTGLATYAQIAPAAGSTSNTATLAAPTIDLNDVAMVRVSIIGMTLSNNSLVGHSIGAWDDAALYGARLTLPPSSPYLTIATFPISSSSNPQAGATNYAPRENAENLKPRTLTNIYYPQSRWNYALEGDSTLAAFKHTKLDKGVVIPRLRVTTGSTAARYIRFQRFELEVCYRG